MPRIPAEQTSPYEQRLVTARGVASRYGIHLRSIARWVARGIIPPPDQVICDRRYWYLEALDHADRRRTTEAGAKGNPSSHHSPAP